MFEVFLFAPVVEEKSCARVGGGVIELRLYKKEEMIWGQLQSSLKGNMKWYMSELCGIYSCIIIIPVDKEGMKKKREEAVKVAQERAEQEQAERATKRRDAEKFSIKQEMKVCLGFVDV